MEIIGFAVIEGMEDRNAVNKLHLISLFLKGQHIKQTDLSQKCIAGFKSLGLIFQYLDYLYIVTTSIDGNNSEIYNQQSESRHVE